MKRGSLIIAGLVLLSLVVSLAAQEPGSDSPMPSVTNKGPRGLAALATWLREADVTVIEHDAPLTQLPPETRTVVVAAPAGEELREDEVAALKTFVEGGGTLVYLVARQAPQPILNQWLNVHPGPTPPLVTEPELKDVGGTSVSVVFAAGLLDGAKTLRLSADRAVTVSDERAVAVTSDSAVWWMRRGRGEVWLSGGPDLAENARLELADNAVFWGHLVARGPIVFDEYHQHRGASVVPVNLLITGLQLTFLAFLFVWARATRLGPARDQPQTWHRSSLEYVTAMAALTSNAGVEDELVVALKAEFRRFLRDRLGVPVEWTWEEADAELARRTSIEAGALVTASSQPEFVKLSQELAKLEKKLRG